MKMYVNRMFRIAAALLPLLAAGCSDPDEGPGKPLEITLSAQTLELERSETAACASRSRPGTMRGVFPASKSRPHPADRSPRDAR